MELFELEDMIAQIQRENAELRKANKETRKNSKDILDDVFRDFLKVVDTYDATISDINSHSLGKNPDVMTALASMDDVRRRMLSLLKKNGVEKITFPDGKPKAGFCAVTSEEIDPTRENGDIVSIERDGYTRDGQLLRRAEIVVVKNK